MTVQGSAPGATALNARRYSIAVIAGDGIGPEVMASATACIDKAIAGGGAVVDWQIFPWGSDFYRRTGRMMPEEGLRKLEVHDAIFLGAVGTPGIDDVTTLWGLLIPIRRAFEQYVNLRPMRLLPGIVSPLRDVDAIDIVVVRENSEGEYSEVGGRISKGLDDETALQETAFSRKGIERVTRFAARLATERSGSLISATKSNGIIHTMPFWDEVVSETAKEWPDIHLESVLIDALAAKLILDPSSCDVIVASNLFGDILSDLVSALAGSLGVAPSANLNPERKWPSMFEPVHGSAPDIAGKGVANPIGQIWSGVMMLEYLGEADAASRLMSAMEGALRDGVRTHDLGGSASTADLTYEILRRI